MPCPLKHIPSSFSLQNMWIPPQNVVTCFRAPKSWGLTQIKSEPNQKGARFIRCWVQNSCRETVYPNLGTPKKSKKSWWLCWNCSGWKVTKSSFFWSFASGMLYVRHQNPSNPFECLDFSSQNLRLPTVESFVSGCATMPNWHPGNKRVDVWLQTRSVGNRFIHHSDSGGVFSVPQVRKRGPFRWHVDSSRNLQSAKVGLFNSIPHANNALLCI